MSNAITFQRPLLSMETAKAVLDLGEDAVLALIECGKIRFAFDFKRPEAHRRMLRILSLSLVDFVRRTDTQPATLDGVVKYVLPGSSASVTAVWLARQWNACSTHLNGLIASGCLAEIRSSDRQATASRQVTRASAIDFLKDRRCV